VADEKVVDRIRKLLELAKNNPNEHEAALAAERAQTLMLEHNIEFATVDKKEGVDKVDLDNPWGRHAWYQQLAFAVADACCCKGFAAPGHKPGRKMIWFVGRSTDIAAAQVLLEWLRLELMRIADSRGRMQTRQWKDSYMMGAVMTVRDVLRERKKKLSHGTALVKYNADVAGLVQLWLDARGIQVESAEHDMTVEERAYRLGRVDGMQAQIDAPEKRLK